MSYTGTRRFPRTIGTMDVSHFTMPYKNSIVGFGSIEPFQADPASAVTVDPAKGLVLTPAARAAWLNAFGAGMSAVPSAVIAGDTTIDPAYHALVPNWTDAADVVAVEREDGGGKYDKYPKMREWVESQTQKGLFVVGVELVGLPPNVSLQQNVFDTGRDFAFLLKAVKEADLGIYKAAYVVVAEPTVAGAVLAKIGGWRGAAVLGALTAGGIWLASRSSRSRYASNPCGGRSYPR